MDDVRDVQIVDCGKSNFVKPLRIHYTQNGKKKIWDALKTHDSVVILIYHKTRKAFILVRQFRPAVYISKAELTTDSESGAVSIDHVKYPGSLGLTYELCAGIVDKDKSVEEIAVEEVLEECGYNVPVDSLHRITGFISNVGTSGAHQNMYYVEVCDEQRVGPGGGNPAEGELIDVVEVPVTEGQKFIFDETKTKPVGAMFALQWFYDNIYPNIDK